MARPEPEMLPLASTDLRVGVFMEDELTDSELCSTLLAFVRGVFGVLIVFFLLALDLGLAADFLAVLFGLLFGFGVTLAAVFGVFGVGFFFLALDLVALFLALLLAVASADFLLVLGVEVTGSETGIRDGVRLRERRVSRHKVKLVFSKKL